MADIYRDVVNFVLGAEESKLSPQEQTSLIILGFLLGVAGFGALLWALAKFVFKLETADYRESVTGLVAGSFVGLLTFKVLHPLLRSMPVLDWLFIVAGAVFMVVVTATIMGGSKKAYISSVLVYVLIMAIAILYGVV